jgi:hypothetical protein
VADHLVDDVEERGEDRGRLVRPVRDRHLDLRHGRRQRTIDDAPATQVANRGRHQGDAQASRDEAEIRLHAPRLLQHLRREAGAAARADQQVVVPGGGVTREHDHRILSQLGEVHGGPPRQAVCAREDCHQRLALDRLDDQAGLVDGKAHETDLDAAVAQGIGLRAGEERVEADVDGREARAPDPEDAREDVQIGRRHEPDGQLADLAAAGAARRAHGALRVREHPAHLVEERMPRGGELDAAVRAMEQVDAELAFELSDLLAERRLRHVQARRGAAEVQLLRDGQEVAEVAELHGGDSYPAGLNSSRRLYWTTERPHA